MCGRFVMLSAEEVADVVAAVERRAGLRALGDDPNVVRAQARPGNLIATIGRDGDALAASEHIWGFATEWSANPVFNTRIESALSGSAMWRDAFRDGRCIIPAVAFFEPHATETEASPRTGRPMKRQYRFDAVDGFPLLMAGLRQGDRCSIVTAQPNRWVEPIHDRMPLLLRFDEVDAWLDGAQPPSAASTAGYELLVRPERSDDAAAPRQLSLF